jgi:hypothetical protein
LILLDGDHWPSVKLKRSLAPFSRTTTPTFHATETSPNYGICRSSWTPTYCAAALHAKPSALLAFANPFPMTGAISLFNLYYLPMQSTIFDAMLDANQPGSSGKTSPESSIQATTPSVPSWEAWSGVQPPSLNLRTDGPARVWLMGQPDAPPGGSWTPSTSAWPSDGSGSSCSLAAVLEDGPLPTRYFLSSKAAAGILRRAEARGKELPEALKLALQAVASRT